MQHNERGINDIPDETLQHIFDFLPITEIWRLQLLAARYKNNALYYLEHAVLSLIEVIRLFGHLPASGIREWLPKWRQLDWYKQLLKKPLTQMTDLEIISYALLNDESYSPEIPEALRRVLPEALKQFENDKETHDLLNIMHLGLISREETNTIEPRVVETNYYADLIVLLRYRRQCKKSINLVGADLSFRTLRDLQLEHANLNGVTMYATVCIHVSFAHCSMIGACLYFLEINTEINFSYVNLTDANLHLGIDPSVLLKKIRFDNTNLTRLSFITMFYARYRTSSGLEFSFEDMFYSPREDMPLIVLTRVARISGALLQHPDKDRLSPILEDDILKNIVARKENPEDQLSLLTKILDFPAFKKEICTQQTSFLFGTPPLLYPALIDRQKQLAAEIDKNSAHKDKKRKL